MFHGWISLNSVLRLMLVNFVSGFRVESMYMSCIKSIRSNLTHLYGFQQLVLLPWIIEIAFFICSNRINLLNPKEGSDRLVIIEKGFLKLLKSHMLLKQKSLSLPKNLALGTFGELLILFSKMVNLLYLLYLIAHRCCLLHLIKQNCSLKLF